MIMYIHSMERDLEDFKLQAKMHGAKFQDDKTTSLSKPQSPMMFRDPKEYEDMSMEERQKLTEQMMGMHRAWARGPMVSALGKG